MTRIVELPVTDRIEIPNDEAVLAFGVPAVLQEFTWGWIHYYERKGPQPYHLRFGRPHKPKSTGPESENNHFWGHVRQIAGFIGDPDVEGVADVILQHATAEPWSYPYEMTLGKVKPQPWSEASSAEAWAGIECCHYLAAAVLHFELIEKDWARAI